ncbi:hypothetical protein [Tunturiibacter empetritectus]|uniref:hypothetical protein n=1 Tax=Tunturiibacter empetritectus TaxID=3069691 RepID=UPI003D9ADA54
MESTTLHQARIAAQQLGGSLSRQITPIKQQLISLIAVMEAGIDFAEDDIDLLPQAQITTQIAAIQAPSPHWSTPLPTAASSVKASPWPSLAAPTSVNPLFSIVSFNATAPSSPLHQVQPET